MAVQKRNSEMVDLLRADFVHKNDSFYTWAMLQNMYTMLPGITAFWSMGAESKDTKIRLGTKSYYDLANERLSIAQTLGATDATLEVGRGTGANGTAVFQGSVIQSHFNYGVAEDSYIRGGKVASKLLLGDANTGGIQTGTGPFISFNTIGDGWKAFPFTNSGGTTWANFGGGWQVCQYQKFGDWLLVRGLATRTAGAGVIVGNLPLNYRPVNPQLHITTSNDAYARLELQVSGDLQITVGYAVWVALWVAFSLI